MLQIAAPLFEQNLGYARKLVADLSDDQMTTQPLSTCVLNHAAFVIGHLAWVCDFGVTLLGETAAIDPKWRHARSIAHKHWRHSAPWYTTRQHTPHQGRFAS
jgi:hypothetical protein